MTDRSLTSSDKSASSFLAGRDARQALIGEAVGQGRPATVFVSLNIPGEEKALPGSEALFLCAVARLRTEFSDLKVFAEGEDILGPYAIYLLDDDPVDVKRRTVGIESIDQSMRLVDLDVYAVDGTQVDRGYINSPARACLICDAPAAECIRAKRHAFADVLERVHELLARHRA